VKPMWKDSDRGKAEMLRENHFLMPVCTS